MNVKLTAFLLLSIFINLHSSEIANSSSSSNQRVPNDVETIISVNYSVTTDNIFKVISKTFQENYNDMEIDEIIENPESRSITTKYKYGKMKAEVIESLKAVFMPNFFHSMQIQWTTGVCSVCFYFNNETEVTQFEKTLDEKIAKKFGIIYNSYPKMNMIKLAYTKEKLNTTDCKKSIDQFLGDRSIKTIKHQMFTAPYA